MNNYVVYHLHTMLSNGVTNIDSITNYNQYVERAKELGMKAMAFSEHGSVFEWLKKKEAIESAGMKYIHAEEFYITESLDEKIRDNYHCILIAKNWDGVKELNKLSSISFNRNDGHYYYVPRITFDELINTSDNIIITTACLASILASDNAVLKERFLGFLTKNKHRCFLEIQHHNVEEQKWYNLLLYEVAKTSGIPLIAGTDTHALNKDHLIGREILQRSKKIHFENENDWDLSFKSYEELIAAYELQDTLPMDVVEIAINNTNVMADMIEEFAVDKSYKYPHLWDNPEELIMQKIQQGIKDKGIDKYPNYQEYLDRIEYEMEAYKHNEAIDFMLLMEDIISWCKSQDIQVGYGRGSVNGSVVAWILGITEMDSIRFNLNFDRFMNVERVSLSDIDTDIPPSRIDEVKRYVFEHHGLYCSDIITFNTIADKGAIRDVARALEIDLETVGKICDSVDNEEQYEKYKKQYKELFKYVDLVKGCVVSIGNHPCGMITSPTSIDDAIGLCTTSTDEFPISQLYMKEVDSLNYVKLDLLKLDTIQLLSDTCKLANIPMILPDNMDINDEAVWESIRDDTTSIFQWESKSAQEYIKRLFSDNGLNNEDTDKITLLTIGNSAIRPAGASYRDDLANGVIRTTGSKPIDDFLSNTFGYLVFQCQIIEFLHQYCGFTMGEADIVRRGFAKKTGTDQYIPIIKDGGYMNGSDHYIDGYIKTMKDKYGISEEKSEEDIVAFIQVIEDASSYLFSLNHSQPYSFLGYACGYLRYYYPLQFITCCLNINKDNAEKTSSVTKYADANNIKIVPIKFRYSKADYSCNTDEGVIYKGIASIKYMNAQIAEELFELGNNKYNNFIDLLLDINTKTTVNSRQLDILIKLNFFSEFGEINELLWYVSVFEKIYKGNGELKTNIKASKIEPLGSLIEPFAKEIKPREIKEINLEALTQSLKDNNPDGLVYWNSILTQCEKHKKTGEFNGYNFGKIFKLTEMREDVKERFATKVSEEEYRDVDSYGFLTSLKYNGKPKKVKTIIEDQIEYLGYIEYKNPKLSGNYIVVTNLNTTYSPTFKAVRLCDGKSCDLKVHKSGDPRKNLYDMYKTKEFNNGDILAIARTSKKPKMRKVDDEWIEIPGEYHWWLDRYDIINL